MYRAGWGSVRWSGTSLRSTTWTGRTVPTGTRPCMSFVLVNLGLSGRPPSSSLANTAPATPTNLRTRGRGSRSLWQREGAVVRRCGRVVCRPHAATRCANGRVRHLRAARSAGQPGHDGAWWRDARRHGRTGPALCATQPGLEPQEPHPLNLWTHLGSWSSAAAGRSGIERMVADGLLCSSGPPSMPCRWSSEPAVSSLAGHDRPEGLALRAGWRALIS